MATKDLGQSTTQSSNFKISPIRKEMQHQQQNATTTQSFADSSKAMTKMQMSFFIKTGIMLKSNIRKSNKPLPFQMVSLSSSINDNKKVVSPFKGPARPVAHQSKRKDNNNDMANLKLTPKSRIKSQSVIENIPTMEYKANEEIVILGEDVMQTLPPLADTQTTFPRKDSLYEMLKTKAQLYTPDDTPTKATPSPNIRIHQFLMDREKRMQRS